jgi:high-affinity iron transporter
MLPGVLPAFVLYLREGLEASLIISILFAVLRQLGQLQHRRAIWGGVALAVLCSALGGVAVYATVREYDGSTFQTIFETGTYLVAVVLLTYMTFWMQSHSRTLKKELAAKAGVASGGFALGLLAFTSVGREGLESAVFTLAFAFQSNGWLLGAALGIATSLVLCVFIYRLGYRLDYRIFFRIMGILLLFFAAGLVGNAIQNMQELGWIHIGTAQLWNTSKVISQDTPFGDLLHGLLGYSETPSVLQAIMYIVYLAVAGIAFWRLTRKPGTPAPVAGPTTTPGALTRNA